MKIIFLKSVSVLVFLFALNMSTHAQTVPFTNNLPCDVIIGYELRDASCGVCDWGNLTIPANTTVNYVVNALCGSVSSEGCIWVVSIAGSAVTPNHMSWNLCCSVPLVSTGPEPTGCSSSGNFNVIYNYPTGWSINP